MKDVLLEKYVCSTYLVRFGEKNTVWIKINLSTFTLGLTPEPNVSQQKHGRI